MEDVGSSNRTRSNERKSMFSIFSDGVGNIKKVMEFGDTLLKCESLDWKLNRLKRKLDVLKAKEEDINTELNYAESLSLKRWKKEVENWLKGERQIKNEVQRTEKEVQETKGKWIPNLP